MPKVNSDCASGDTPEKVNSIDAVFGVPENPRKLIGLVNGKATSGELMLDGTAGGNIFV